MAILEVITTYQAHELWMMPSCLGSNFDSVSDGMNVSVVIPGRPDDLLNKDDRESIRVPSVSYAEGYFGNRGQVFRLHLFAVLVSFESDLDIREKPDLSASDQEKSKFVNRAQKIWEPAHSLSEDVANKFLQWLRSTTGQPWLGIASEAAAQYGLSSLLDKDSGHRLAAWGPLNTATLQSDSLAIDLDGLREAAIGAVERRDPPVVRSLLADARALSHDSNLADNARAVLSAATASEIEVKRTLRKVAGTEAEAVVELLLKKQSSLDSLCGQCMKAVIGSSLKELDEDLYKGVCELATKRNLIVHRGEAISEQDGRRLVGVAWSLFEFLQGM